MTARPIASPFASRAKVGICCRRAADRRDLPTNVLPPVAGGRPGCAYSACQVSRFDRPRGELAFFSDPSSRPIGIPFPRGSVPPSPSSPPSGAGYVPAKEMRKWRMHASFRALSTRGTP